MGYVATSVNIPSVKKALFETTTYYLGNCGMAATTAYHTFFKQTMNFTDIDRLQFSLYGEQNTTMRTSIDGSVESTCSPSNQYTYFSIDCSGMTGELVLLIECTNVDAGAAKALKDICFWHRET